MLQDVTNIQTYKKRRKIGQHNVKISKVIGKEKRNGGILSSNEAVICLES